MAKARKKKIQLPPIPLDRVYVLTDAARKAIRDVAECSDPIGKRLDAVDELRGVLDDVEAELNEEE